MDTLALPTTRFVFDGAITPIISSPYNQQTVTNTVAITLQTKSSGMDWSCAEIRGTSSRAAPASPHRTTTRNNCQRMRSSRLHSQSSFPVNQPMKGFPSHRTRFYRLTVVALHLLSNGRFSASSRKNQGAILP